MNTQANPYIGPRTFLKEERHLFFGRDREARDLSALVASDKLVLFYAQSGAGKSSLINTRLIPELEDKLYEVLPVARVSGNWPEGDKTRNIYIYNLIRSILRREIKASDSLIGLTLSDFLSRLNEDEQGYFYDGSLAKKIRGPALEDSAPWRRALIIDQFEELFSTHPEAWEKRGDFFDQLAQAMQDDPYLWVVMVMREDYIASLDPYVHLLPGGLRTRYYMQRLSSEAAIKAVRKPVESLRPYEPGVAEKLVEDLSRIKVQNPNGTQSLEPGQFVEPVQLQVVCYSLWENLRQGGTITEKDLLEVGDVDEALGKYYEGRVAGVAQAKNVKERLLRDWIQRKLIAPGGIRSMVMQETSIRSGGINDDVIQSLQSDLVRAENRGGTIWYELTHDRLVGPILENNKKWFDENLSPLQRQSSIWNDQERNESWLLRDQALVEVENWAKANPDELTNLETDFLAACREQQEQIKLNEQARSARRLLRFVAVTSLLLIFAVFAAVFGFVQRGIAVKALATARPANTLSANSLATAKAANSTAVNNLSAARTAEADADSARQTAQAGADKALSGSLVAQADSLKNIDYPLAVLFGMEAYKRDNNLLTRAALFQLLQFTPYQRRFGFAGPVTSVAVSPDGSVIAVASLEQVSLFDATLKSIGKINDSNGVIYTLAFHQYDGRLVLAAGGCVPDGCSVSKGQITLWEITNGESKLLNQRQAHNALVKTVAFSPDGKLLASGSYDTNIILWNLENLESPQQVAKPLIENSSFVNSLVFSPDGKILISASDDKTIRLWRLSNLGNASLLGPARNSPHTAPVTCVAVSSTGNKLASVSDDGDVVLWDWNSTLPFPLTNPIILKGHTGYVKSVAFNGPGTVLASAGFDNRIILWDTNTQEQIGPPLSVHSSAINSIAFGTEPEEKSSYLVSGSNDRTIIRWNLSARQPLSYTSKSDVELSDSGEQVLNDSNGKFSASVIGQQIDVQSLKPEEVIITLDGFDSPVQYVKFDSRDTQSLRTMDENQANMKWMTRWSIDSSEWVNLACKAITQNLTEAAFNQLWDRFIQKLQLPAGEQPRASCNPSQN